MYQFVSLLTIIAVCVWPPPASCQLVCAMANNVHLFIWWFFAGRKFKWRFVLPETSQLEINAHSTTTPTTGYGQFFPSKCYCKCSLRHLAYGLLLVSVGWIIWKISPDDRNYLGNNGDCLLGCDPIFPFFKASGSSREWD